MDNINIATAMWSASICCQQSWWYAIVTFLHQGDIGVIFRINSDKWNNASIGDDNTFPLCTCRMAVHKILYAMQNTAVRYHAMCHTSPSRLHHNDTKTIRCLLWMRSAYLRTTALQLETWHSPKAMCQTVPLEMSDEQADGVSASQCQKLAHDCRELASIIVNYNAMFSTACERQLVWSCRTSRGGLSSDWWYTIACCIRRSSHPIREEICAARKTSKAPKTYDKSWLKAHKNNRGGIYKEIQNRQLYLLRCLQQAL